MRDVRRRFPARPLRAAGTGLSLLAAAWVADLYAQDVPAGTVSTPVTQPATGTAPSTRAVEAVRLSDAEVTAAIRRGAEFLLHQRNAKGTWEGLSHFAPEHPLEGGETALVLWALLQAGDALDDPRLTPQAPELAPAIKYLVGLHPQSVYTASVQARVLALLPLDGPVRGALQRARNYLADAMHSDGSFGYAIPKNAADRAASDHSNSHYALLGMLAVTDVGIDAPRDFWPTLSAYWHKTQRADGGWAYTDARTGEAPESTASMTACGLASLYALQSFAKVDPKVPPRADPAVASALGWLERNVDLQAAPLDTLAAVERAGRFGGLKLLGGRDWFRIGAVEVLRRQQPDGRWSATSWLTGNTPSATWGTACALRFLAQGNAPLILHKLRYEGAGDAHPRDAAHLAASISRTLDKPLHWQQVDFAMTPVQWGEAPVLLLTGSKDPHLTAPQIARLREFVAGGGLILSAADGGSNEFTEAVVKKYAPQISENRYRMRDLPLDHPLFNLGVRIGNPPTVFGLSNGLREWWVHCPNDLGAAWQRPDAGPKESWSLAANVFFYATDKGRHLPTRLEATALPEPQAPLLRHMALGRLRYTGNWDPEPAAWPRMATLAAAQFHTDVRIAPVTCAILNVQQTPVVHMTGTTAFTLEPEELQSLRAYLDAGGLLIADAAGSSPEFTESFRSLMSSLYPKLAAAPLPLNHPLYNGALPESIKIAAAQYREASATPQNKGLAPRLTALANTQGRVLILFSSDDITSGLLDAGTWGIPGYLPLTAQALARDMLLYAAGRDTLPGPSATRPTTLP